MITMYLYNKNNLDEIIEQPAISPEDYKERIREYFPPFDSDIYAISDKKYSNPIWDITTNELREMNKKELYDIGKYTLSVNEIIENGEIKEVVLKEFEYIEDNQIKFNRTKKIEAIEKELYQIRIEKEVSPFEVEINGKTYLQQNRVTDQSAITKVLFQIILMFIYKLLLNAIKGKIPDLATIFTSVQKLNFENWKFYTVDNSEKYENVTLLKFLEMSQKMKLQTTISMITETELKHKLLNLTDEEIKNFDATAEYSKRYAEEMEEAIKKENEIGE